MDAERTTKLADGASALSGVQSPHVPLPDTSTFAVNARGTTTSPPAATISSSSQQPSISEEHPKGWSWARTKQAYAENIKASVLGIGLSVVALTGGSIYSYFANSAASATTGELVKTYLISASIFWATNTFFLVRGLDRKHFLTPKGDFKLRQGKKYFIGTAKTILLGEAWSMPLRNFTSKAIANSFVLGATISNSISWFIVNALYWSTYPLVREYFLPKAKKVDEN